jgi:glycosyltransferase involved in cell wall biosynthesis
MNRDCTVVVPYFDEATRFDPEPIADLLAKADVDLVAVDDGSTDDTPARLAVLADAHPDRVTVLTLDANHGKAEAVRQGMRAALDAGAPLVAYCDADFATPPGEVARLVDALRADVGLDAVLGSRVAMMGTDIRRSAYRHYSGRLFATLGSMVLGVAVYDTQCGAKAFRATDRLDAALRRPFVSRWAFDVELLGRLLPGRFREVPLQTWHDPGGSHMTVSAGLRATVDLVRIRRDLQRTRAGSAS